MTRSIFMLCVAVLCGIPAYPSTLTHRTDQQFNAGTHDRTQVRDTGDNAYLQLLFKWQEVTGINKPPARAFSPLSYNTEQNIALLFGGYGSPTVYGDTWEYNLGSGNWQSIASNAPYPSASYAHGMVYLGANETLLFGGFNGSVYSSDTWKYKKDTATDNNWTKLSVAISTAPSPRAFFCMARDSSTNKVILFGGRNGAVKSNETWVYTISGSSWTLKFPATKPSARSGAAMASDNNGKVYMFGGTDSSNNKKDELWVYNIGANTWEQKTKATGSDAWPSAKEDAGFLYDPWNSNLLLYGGSDNDQRMWYYHPGTNKWNYGEAKDAPAARQQFGSVYVPTLNKTLVFGGFSSGTGYTDSQYFYTYHSSGIFTSPVMDAPFQTSLQWLRVSLEPTSQAAQTEIKFRVASSSDNITWDIFRGPNGDPNDYYIFLSGISGYDLNCSTHNDRRYIKYRLYFNSTKPPNAPQINSVSVRYNRAPVAPVLYNPLNGGSTNFVTPLFTWLNATDQDNDILTYHLQVSKNAQFSSTVLNSSGVVSGAGTMTSYSSSTALTHTNYYWRVRADDGYSQSAWGDTFTLSVDTVPPSAITDLTAVTGNGNGAVELSWTPPGNNNRSGSIINGRYKVRFGNNPIMSEAAFAALSGNERIGAYSTPSSGSRASINLTGLSNGTTYYFSVKIADQAGNYSAVSTTSPWAYTNAPPAVILKIPVGNESWTKHQSISWLSSDPNPGDTRTFSIYLSTDAGASYSMTVVQNLSHGTTFYLWDTRMAPNTGMNKIKVVATDLRGLSGQDISPGNFLIYNENESPVVTIIRPNGGEVFSGQEYLLWEVNDPNRTDTHTFDIYISSSSGSFFYWHFTSQTTYYLWDTRNFHNRTTYRIKIVATDSGVGTLTGSAVGAGDFSVSNQNSPPRNFALTYPPNNSARSLIQFKFSWQNNGDPDQFDSIHYTLYYSTDVNFIQYTAITQITDNTYAVNANDLLTETTYYWKVRAEDPAGAWTLCQEVFKVIILDRFSVESEDGKCRARIIQGLPSQGYLKIETIDPASVQSIQRANQETIADRHLKNMEGNLYKLSACDINGQALDVTDPILSVTMTYEDSDSDSYVDNTMVTKESICVGILNESRERWEIPPSLPLLNAGKKYITSTFQAIGMVTMLGVSLPTSGISQVVNYPNPFAAGTQNTRIRYVLLKDEEVTVNIYTLLGDLVLQKHYSAGIQGAKGQPSGYTNEIIWDGRNAAGEVVANGMYLLEIKTGADSRIRKVGVVK